MPLRHHLDFLISNQSTWEEASPCFVVNEQQIRATVEKIKALLPGEILYSHKTNPHPAITRIVNDHGCGFLLSSIEETEKLIGGENIRSERVMFQSPSLTGRQYTKLAALGVSRFIVDSDEQLEIILGSLGDLARTPEIALRINTGITVADAELPYSTDSCLGFPITEAVEVFEQLNGFRKDGKIILGLHNHLLSQNTFLNLWRDNLDVLTDFVGVLRRKSVLLDMVDFGGGYPIYYGQENLPFENIAEEIAVATERMRRAYPNLRFVFEPGRKVVGESIMLATTVAHVKRFRGRDVAILNCSVYNAAMDTLVVGLFLPADKIAKEIGPRREYVIRGGTPDSLDVFSKGISMPELKAGDHLAFFHAGAYSFGSDFISLPKPRHIII